MEVKKKVKAGKTAAPINNHNQKAARRLKVKTDIKAGKTPLPIMTQCPIMSECQ